MASQLVEDFRQVIAGATQAELERHSGDTMMKRHRTAQAIGIQGMILDAMDDGRLEMGAAHQLLCEIQQRLKHISKEARSD